jgi:cysteine desulfuration protein SufE
VLPSENERSLIDAFSGIDDPHERLSMIVTSCAGAGIPENLRRDIDLVPGCVSRVWLTAAAGAGALRLHWDAGSPLVKGLAGLVARVYDGSPPRDAAAFDTVILTALGLDRRLSPTRLLGLHNVSRRIRLLAAGLDSAQAAS